MEKRCPMLILVQIVHLEELGTHNGSSITKRLRAPESRASISSESLRSCGFQKSIRVRSRTLRGVSQSRRCCAMNCLKREFRGSVPRCEHAGVRFRDYSIPMREDIQYWRVEKKAEEMTCDSSQLVSLLTDLPVEVV